jgi:hypothetical protein
VQAVVLKRDEVTAAYIADWRKLSDATSTYAKRVDATLLQGSKAACEDLRKGVAAKGPAEILVTCHKRFEQARTAVAEKLRDFEQAVGK